VLDSGVRTPLTAAYVDALLEITGAPSIEQVERVVRESGVLEGGIDGMG
jgi:hypothetical protein